MEIKPNNRYGPVPPVETRLTRRITQPPAEMGEFAGTEALQRALNATPDIRPEAVARGKALAESPDYPPAKTLEGLARLFALSFGPSEPPSDNPPVAP